MSAIVNSLSRSAQEALLAEIVSVIGKAPLFRPAMPRWGTPFSVKMSNCGPLGWVSDKSGYRYQAVHPVTGRPWPAMPEALLEIWTRLSGYAHPPEACLINYYAADAKMGLHQDRDEADLAAPVISVSLGDEARFKLGGVRRHDRTETVLLRSGDVISLQGPTRLAFHGIERLLPGTSDLLAPYPELFAGGGRINLTLRRVTAP